MAQVERRIQLLSPRAARAFAADCAARVQFLYEAWYPGDPRLATAIACARTVEREGYGTSTLTLRHDAVAAAQEALDQSQALLDRASALNDEQKGACPDLAHATRLTAAACAAIAASSCLDPDPTQAALRAARGAEQARYNQVGPARPEGVTVEHYRAVEERFWQLLQLEPATLLQ